MEDTICIAAEPEKNRAAAYDGTKEIGECTFDRTGSTYWTLTHTEVDPAYGGRGLAGKLVEKAADMARKEHVGLLPACAYAAALFKRKEKEFDDVWVRD